ncbi:baseplate J/gp47 family protein [Patescibacteria group bacterium]|nr:baseplate J/gp47 family protein [Patescibacteria group bacterium]
MKLPFFSFLEKKEKTEYFLALVLRNEQINAVFLEELAGKIRVVGKHKEYFKDSIEEASINELLEVFDKAISTAEEALPKEAGTIKTIFGVKQSWVEDNKIKKEYLLKLKKVSDELGLVPIGFLVNFEAIAHLLAKEEGAPPTAILVETGKKFISIALIRAGKIIEVRTSQIHESPSQTVDTLLKHVTEEILPSRIIIFDQESEDEAQEFINHRWSKSLPFLHLPQVITLPSEFDGRAVLFGAALQMGFEVLEEEYKEEPIKQPSEEEEEMETEEIGIEGKIKHIGKETSMEYFGFIEDKDILKHQLPKREEEIEKEIKEDVIEQQISEIPEAVKLEEAEKEQLPKQAVLLLQGFLKFAKGLPAKGAGRRNFLIPLVIIAIIVITVSLFYVFVTRASVVLTISPKIEKQNQDVVFSTSSPTDSSKGIVAAEFLSVSEDGNITKATTGKKEVGTKAKGTVTIFNNSSAAQNLSSGTTITSGNNGLEFALEKNVTVASAAGDIFTGTTPGKATVSVVALKIGTEYNLPSNTKFSVGGNSSVAAKNDSPFSGGTKKEITVVSKDDIEKLLADLPKNLEQNARDDLLKKRPQDKVILPVFIGNKIISKNIDKNVGDEAGNVTLKATIEYQGISYAKSDLLSLALVLLKNKISSDLTIEPNDIKVDAKDIKQKGDKDVSSSLTIEAPLRPKINDTQLKKDIAGKSIKSAQDRLLKIPEVSNADVKFSWSLPLLPKRLPVLERNIKIITKVND